MFAKITDDEKDTEEMSYALSSIVKEIKKFNDDLRPFDSGDAGQNKLDKVLNFNTILNLKNNQVNLLRRNLKTACIVAKSLSEAKANETKFLNEQLNHLNNHCRNLENEKRENIYLVNILRTENKTLRDKLQCFNNFIQLGYRELKKHHDEKPEANITDLGKLQNIIRYCEKYQEDYHIQVVKYKQIEQKNRYLNSKLRIVERNLQAITEKLKNPRTINNLKNESKRDIRSKSVIFTNLGVVCSDYEIERHKKITNLKMLNIQLKKDALLEPLLGFDLTSHFSTVKKLLDDQDTLIKDLKCLSNEIINEESFHDET